MNNICTWYYAAERCGTMWGGPLFGIGIITGHGSKWAQGEGGGISPSQFKFCPICSLPLKLEGLTQAEQDKEAFLMQAAANLQVDRNYYMKDYK